MSRRLAFVVTCEHAGNRIPPPYRALFADREDALRSHHGYDRGALAMARELARAFDAALFYSTVSRLLVDLNRSPRHARLHADVVRRLTRKAREEILADWYAPFRTAAERAIAAAVGRGAGVIHVSSHSFTPVLDGKPRNADIGLLYDPARPGEVALCDAWQAALGSRAPDLHVRRNYPYRGTSDGFAALLRRRFGAHDYIGIELEINQRLTADARRWRQRRLAVVASLRDALAIRP